MAIVWMPFSTSHSARACRSAVDAEGAHDLGLVGAGDADVDFLCADVGAGGMGVDDGQAVSGADFALIERAGCRRAGHRVPPERR